MFCKIEIHNRRLYPAGIFARQMWQEIVFENIGTCSPGKKKPIETVVTGL
jgi:hypothetical protein